MPVASQPNFAPHSGNATPSWSAASSLPSAVGAGPVAGWAPNAAASCSVGPPPGPANTTASSTAAAAAPASATENQRRLARAVGLQPLAQRERRAHLRRRAADQRQRAALLVERRREAGVALGHRLELHLPRARQRAVSRGREIRHQAIVVWLRNAHSKML